MLDDPAVERVLGHVRLISQERGEARLVPQNEQEHNSKDVLNSAFASGENFINRRSHQA